MKYGRIGLKTQLSVGDKVRIDLCGYLVDCVVDDNPEDSKLLTLKDLNGKNVFIWVQDNPFLDGNDIIYKGEE